MPAEPTHNGRRSSQTDSSDSAPRSHTPSDAATDGSDRLNGWKEISNYLGKGVRTAQRWERQFGMPVHRIGGEVVFARRSEIEAWSSSKSGHRGQNGALDLPADANGETDDRDDTPLVLSARVVPLVQRHPHYAALVIALAAVALTVAIGMGIVLVRRGNTGSGPITDVRLAGNALQALDEGGNVLWSHPFESRQAPIPERDSPLYATRFAIVDITGDGRPEVLYLTLGGDGRQQLLAFNPDGTVRFEHQWTGSVHFGDQNYDGPLNAMWLWVTRATDGTPSIWLSSRHLVEFPSVLERIDPSGTVTGQYWSGGEITSLMAGRLGGRDMVLVGSVMNEGYGAGLAVFDAADFGGTAPAFDARHTCQSCPAKRPLRFFAFPQGELGKRFHSEGSVRGMALQSDGEFTVVVDQLDVQAAPLGRTIYADVNYTFASDFTVKRGDFTQYYRMVHDLLHEQGKIDHGFAGHDTSELFPILEWRGGKFVDVWPKNRELGPGTRDQGTARQAR